MIYLNKVIATVTYIQDINNKKEVWTKMGRFLRWMETTG
jgi:hypothetical protein